MVVVVFSVVVFSVAVFSVAPRYSLGQSGIQIAVPMSEVGFPLELPTYR